jgi:hypothetical protein
LEDLQEMQNHMRASIDRGLEELQAHQGGLPSPPQSAAAPPVEASFAPIAPPADPNVSRELQEQEHQADTAEQEVLNEVKQADVTGNASNNSTAAGGAVGTPSPAAEASKPPVEIALGQTIEQVVASLGSPKQIVKLGPKQIYVYSDIKITFVDGKVSDVQ